MSATPETTARVVAHGRGRNITIWVTQVLLAVAFVSAGLPKLTGVEAAVDMFDSIGIGQWFRYLTGTLEVAGAIGLLIPRLAGLAALGLVGVMVGAVITELFVIGGNPAVPILLLLLAAAVAWSRRDRTGALIGARPHSS